MHHHQGTKVEKLGNPNHAGLPKIIQQESFIRALRLLSTLTPCFTLFGILVSVECTGVFIMLCIFLHSSSPSHSASTNIAIVGCEVSFAHLCNFSSCYNSAFPSKCFPLPHQTLSDCGDCGRLLPLVREKSKYNTSCKSIHILHSEYSGLFVVKSTQTYLFGINTF